MAVVGCLGSIAFSVSHDVVKTVSNLQWSGSASYATHQRHMNSTLTEFTGTDPDTLTFDMEISVYLGVNPMSEITKILAYERSGQAVPFILGNHAYGRYRWTIASHKVKAQAFDGRGNVTSATVSISLQEYLRS